MPTAEIITIGTELLLGEIVDTNAPHIARQLREIGVDVFRTISVGDNTERIAQVLQESITRAKIIITTGGLGPTVDDPTRDAVARAFGVDTKFHEELWQQVIDRFARFDLFPPENNKRQAYIPEGAMEIENPIGTAPAFRMEFPFSYPSSPPLPLKGGGEKGVVICLPGVPREMEHLLEHDVIPFLRERFSLNSVLRVRVLHTSGVGESLIDERIGDLEERSNPTVGLAAHSGQVDVRITAKANSVEEVESLIRGTEKDLRQRLGKWIFGADEETLEKIAMQILHNRDWNLVVIEVGLEGNLLRKLVTTNPAFLRGELLPTPPDDPEELSNLVDSYRQAHNADVGLGVALYPGEEKSDIYLALITPFKQKTLRTPYGGPPKLAPRRAVNLGLDQLRKL